MPGPEMASFCQTGIPRIFSYMREGGHMHPLRRYTTHVTVLSRDRTLVRSGSARGWSRFARAGQIDSARSARLPKLDCAGDDADNPTRSRLLVSENNISWDECTLFMPQSQKTVTVIESIS